MTTNTKSNKKDQAVQTKSIINDEEAKIPIRIVCPHCRRSYVIRVNLPRIRKTKPRAVCSRCGGSFDVLKRAVALKEKTETPQKIRPAQPISPHQSDHQQQAPQPQRTPEEHKESTNPTEAREPQVKDETEKKELQEPVQQQAQLQRKKDSLTSILTHNEPKEVTSIDFALPDINDPFPWISQIGVDFQSLSSKNVEQASELDLLLSIGNQIPNTPNPPPIPEDVKKIEDSADEPQIIIEE